MVTPCLTLACGTAMWGLPATLRWVWPDEQMVAMGWPDLFPGPGSWHGPRVRVPLTLTPRKFCQGSTRHRRHRGTPSTSLLVADFLAHLELPGADPWSWRTGQASTGRPAHRLHLAGFRGLCPPRLPTNVLRGVHKPGGAEKS